MSAPPTVSDMEAIVEPLKRQLAYFEEMSVQLVAQIKSQSEEIAMLRRQLTAPSPQQTEVRSPSVDPESLDLPEDVKKLVDSIVRRRVRHYTSKMEAGMSHTLKEYLGGITDDVIEDVVERRLKESRHFVAPRVDDEITRLLDELRVDHPDVFIPRV